ncbi:unknown [Oscillibacter sp. CAG:155]|nr:unknown [Oscillibacter sp. CAG:155]
MSFAQEAGTTPLIVGNGTNLLVSDRGLDRLGGESWTGW